MRHNKVLIIDDEPELRNLIKRLLELEGFSILTAGNSAEALEILNKNEIDIVVSDVRLPDKSGLELLPIIKKQFPSMEIIILTAYGIIEDGVNAIKEGAFDYIVKGDEDNKLILVVKNAHEKVKMANRISHLEKNVLSKYSFDSITGSSPLILEAISIAKKSANSEAPILLIGETGTGKEVFAQSIHYESNRRNEPFVAINCSGFAKDLLESEMFGYKAGAFTGAVKNKKGLFEEADRGTLFLDEIGDMDIVLQAKLLRVLENNTFIKAGDTKETSVDVRVIAAINKDLRKLISEGKINESPIKEPLAAISVGINKEGKIIADLNYEEDSSCEADVNLVATRSGKFIEIQGTAEGDPFSQEQLDALLICGKKALVKIFEAQDLAI